MPTIQVTAPSLDDVDLFDLDLEISADTMPVSAAITSNTGCTPGCTSPGGGSFCSFCC